MSTVINMNLATIFKMEAASAKWQEKHIQVKEIKEGGLIKEKVPRQSV